MSRMFLEPSMTRVARLFGLPTSILTGRSCHRHRSPLRFAFLRIWRAKSAVSARSLLLTVPEVHSESEMCASIRRAGRCHVSPLLCSRRKDGPAEDHRSRQLVIDSDARERECDSVHCWNRADTQTRCAIGSDCLLCRRIALQCRSLPGGSPGRLVNRDRIARCCTGKQTCEPELPCETFSSSGWPAFRHHGSGLCLRCVSQPDL